MGDRRDDGQGAVVLDQAIEKLLGDRESIRVGDQGRIESGGVIGQRASIRSAILRRLGVSLRLGKARRDREQPGKDSEADYDPGSTQMDMLAFT